MPAPEGTASCRSSDAMRVPSCESCGSSRCVTKAAGRIHHHPLAIVPRPASASSHRLAGNAGGGLDRIDVEGRAVSVIVAAEPAPRRALRPPARPATQPLAAVLLFQPIDAALEIAAQCRRFLRLQQRQHLRHHRRARAAGRVQALDAGGQQIPAVGATVVRIGTALDGAFAFQPAQQARHGLRGDQQATRETRAGDAGLLLRSGPASRGARRTHPNCAAAARST